MKLFTTLHFVNIWEKPEIVWLSPEAEVMQYTPPQAIEVTDTDQLLEIYTKLNKARMEAEKQVRKLEDKIREQDNEITYLKARLFDLERRRT
jgi:septal ring factor EnvC (AmiA/AmiB activator)